MLHRVGEIDPPAFVVLTFNSIDALGSRWRGIARVVGKRVTERAKFGCFEIVGDLPCNLNCSASCFRFFMPDLQTLPALQSRSARLLHRAL